MDEARFYTWLVRRCKVPRLQMARDMYRAQRRVDTLRNYLEEAESVQAGVWALLCVLSRWLNRYEAELPEGVMGGMGWRLRGRRGCAQNSPFSPGLSWSILGERGKTAMLDFRMDTFLAVCRHRNYTRAAEELNITQPAVTQHIQYLQSYYGVKLFSYQNKRLALTEEGELLRNAALCMLHDEEKLKRDVKDLRLGRRSIRFGATLTIGEYLLPERLAAYMKRNPRVDVHMLVENTQILLRMINDGELDFAWWRATSARASTIHHLVPGAYVCVCAAAPPPGPGGPPAPQRPVRENLILRNQAPAPGMYWSGCWRSATTTWAISATLWKSATCSSSRSWSRPTAHYLPLPQGGGEGAGRGSLCQVALTDFQISHEFTFLWRKNSAFETELRETSRALWTL